MISIAPMMDVTDRHCRFFLRQVNARARLYTALGLGLITAIPVALKLLRDRASRRSR